MTPEQKDIFIETAQLGMVVGLTHPMDWLALAVDNVQYKWPLSPEYIRAGEDDVIGAYAAFLNEADQKVDISTDELRRNLVEWVTGRQHQVA